MKPPKCHNCSAETILTCDGQKMGDHVLWVCPFCLTSQMEWWEPPKPDVSVAIKNGRPAEKA